MTSQSGGAVSGAAGGVLGGTYPSPTFATNGTTPILGTVVSQLSADVAMTNNNQYYDGPSVALTAGTWLLIGSVTVATNNFAGFATAKLWDGTTVYASGQEYGAAAGALVVFPFICSVTPTGPTTYKVSVAGSTGPYAIKAAATLNAVGNNASTLVAVRIA